MYRLDELNDIIEKGFLSLKLHEPPKELYEPIEYMLSMGGKRLRPMTCLMTYNLFHEKIERNVLYPAMALEVFHAFTLIHDSRVLSQFCPATYKIPHRLLHCATGISILPY